MTIGITVTCMFRSFFQFPGKVEVLILLCTFFQFFFCGQPAQQSPQFCKFIFFCWLLWGLVFWSRLGDQFVCQSPIGVYIFYCLGQLLGYAYTIYLFRPIKISRTFPSGSPCPPSHVLSYTPSVQICCILLLCNTIYQPFRSGRIWHKVNF